GETFVTLRWSALARMACQQPCRPQLMRIAVLLGLVARQRHQPSLGLRRDRRLLARSRSLVEGRQRAIGQRPLDAALNRLMMQAESLPHRKERRILAVTEQYLRPLHSTGRLAAGSRNRRQTCNLFVG